MTFGNNFALFTILFFVSWIMLSLKRNYWMFDSDLIEELFWTFIPVFFIELFFYGMIAGTIYGILGKW